MNQHLITLKMWSPNWDDGVDDVDLENRSSVSESLRSFIMNPFGHKVFTSCIPFRMSGKVYGHSKHIDGESILTAFVREVRRVDPIGRTPTFEFETWDDCTYVIDLEHALTTWLYKL